MRKVEVISYQSSWLEAFEEEKQALSRVLGQLDYNIHHIGSTSVPGLAAKPVIDLLIEINNLSLIDQLGEGFQALGYHIMGEHGIKGRRFFMKDTDGKRSHHIHAFERGENDVVRHLAFRDYLKVHPKAKQDYSDLKQKLAKKHPTNMEAYIEGKSPWIKEHESKANIWYKNHD